jgi:hypothetical protein
VFSIDLFLLLEMAVGASMRRRRSLRDAASKEVQDPAKYISGSSAANDLEIFCSTRANGQPSAGG